MKALYQLLTNHWPLSLIGLLILLLCGEISVRILENSFPPGFIGVPLILSGWGALIYLKPSGTSGLLMNVVLLGGLLLAATSTIPENGSIQFLAMTLAIGIGATVFAMNIHTARPSSVSASHAEMTERLTASLPIDDSNRFQSLEEHAEASQQEEVLQSWRRIKLEDVERLEGVVVLEFKANQKIQHFHLPISPAFHALPQAWGECRDLSIRVDFNVLQSYGVRLTARRGAGPLIAESVEIDFVLECRPGSQAVA